MNLRVKIAQEIFGTYLYLEGTDDADVKISLNASSPFQFGESTKSYSATIKAPRNKANDMIFKEIRYFGIYERTKPYYARIELGGITSIGTFNAQVTCDDTSYSIALSQSEFKRSSIPSDILYRGDTTFSVDDSIRHGYDYVANFLKDSFNISSITFPRVDKDNNLFTVRRSTDADQDPKPLKDFLEDQELQFYWRFGTYTETDGGSYFGKTIDIKRSDARLALGYTISTAARTIKFKLDTEAVLYLDTGVSSSTPPPTLYLRCNHDNTICGQFTLVSSADRKMTKYVGSRAAIWTFSIPANVAFKGFRLSSVSTSVSTDTYAALPSQEMLPEAALIMNATITEVTAQTPSGQTIYHSALTDLGFTKGLDMLDAICKACMWRWDFSVQNINQNEKQLNITISQLIHTDAIGEIVYNPDFIYVNHPVPFNNYRQDWSDYYVSHEKTEDSEGMYVNNTVKLKDFEVPLKVTDAVFQKKGELITSAMPVALDKYDTNFMLTEPKASGSVYFGMPIDFFKSEGYINKLRMYFRMFSSGIDVTIKARIPYWTFRERYKENGVYWFRQLQSFFYIRSVTDYSIKTGECKIKMTKINLTN